MSSPLDRLTIGEKLKLALLPEKTELVFIPLFAYMLYLSPGILAHSVVTGVVLLVWPIFMLYLPKFVSLVMWRRGLRPLERLHYSKLLLSISDDEWSDDPESDWGQWRSYHARKKNAE